MPMGLFFKLEARRRYPQWYCASVAVWMRAGHGVGKATDIEENQGIKPRHQDPRGAGPQAHTAVWRPPIPASIAVTAGAKPLEPKQPPHLGLWGSVFDWCVLNSDHTTPSGGNQGDTALTLDTRVLIPMGIGGSMDDPPCLGAPHPGDLLPRTKDANAIQRQRETQTCVLARLSTN